VPCNRFESLNNGGWERALYFAVPHLARIAVYLSLYNILTWSIDWIRFNIGYFGPSFMALIPQIALTVWLALLIKRYEVFQYKILAPIIAITLWAFTLIVNSWELIFSNVELPWSWNYNLLDTLGFPILEMQYGGAAPLLGLFHSNQGDLNVKSDWYFDGGILFSWLSFNIITLILIIFTSRIAIQDRRDGTFR
jgi:hypothetical protein